jgi:hypothetical protein
MHWMIDVGAEDLRCMPGMISVRSKLSESEHNIEVAAGSSSI